MRDGSWNNLKIVEKTYALTWYNNINSRINYDAIKGESSLIIAVLFTLASLRYHVVAESIRYFSELYSLYTRIGNSCIIAGTMFILLSIYYLIRNSKKLGEEQQELENYILNKSSIKRK